MEVSGPPQFLNNSVEEYNPAKEADQQQGRRGGRRHRKEKKDLPAGKVQYVVFSLSSFVGLFICNLYLLVLCHSAYLPLIA